MAATRGWLNMQVSIFNDVIGPVMRGPSSSHCAAALRIGRLARDLAGGQFDEALVEFDRNGSLPTTHDSQGSGMGLFGGLMGWDAADERLPGSAQTLGELGVRVRIETVDAGDPHPNTYRLTLRHREQQHFLRAVSIGGGMMEVKSAMGVIVAAPTAGACAALPGAVIAMAEELGLVEEAMAKAMLTGGLRHSLWLCLTQRPTSHPTPAESPYETRIRSRQRRGKPFDLPYEGVH